MAGSIFRRAVLTIVRWCFATSTAADGGIRLAVWDLLVLWLAVWDLLVLWLSVWGFLVLACAEVVLQASPAGHPHSLWAVLGLLLVLAAAALSSQPCVPE